MEIIINNWISIIVSLVVGQIFLTIWFTVIFGNQWAKSYDSTKSKEEHTKEIPGYTYAFGAICTLLYSIGIQWLHIQFAISSLKSSVILVLFLSLLLIIPVVTPGYLFLKKTNALKIVLGSQIGSALLISIVHYLI